MKIRSIVAGSLRLDGGAMFGVVPKVIWNKTNPADENNLCVWAMRCLLVETGNKKILIDTGMGDKQSEKFYGYYFLGGDILIEDALKRKGVSSDEITDVILTHLHFDHCGGALKKENGKTVPTFKNAVYHISQKHWEHALNPNSREKPSFILENITPIQTNGQLQFLNISENFSENITFLEVNGHTTGQILPLLSLGEKKILYAADLIPSASHIPVSYVMGYDIEPLKTMEEKKEILSYMHSKNGILLYEHDPKIEASSITKTERGFNFEKGIKIEEL